MKRSVSIILALVIIGMGTISNGSISDKLSGHWADRHINRSFIAYYFPYLSKNGFERFEPSGSITNQDFIISTASLFKDYGYDTSVHGYPSVLKRGDMALLLGEKLKEIGLKNDSDNPLTFSDINTMSSTGIESLSLLYNSSIIKGDTDSQFYPDRNLSQVEAIIILQRVKEVLESMNTIAFSTTGIVQTYNNQEELIVKEDSDKVLVTITKQFPTPGYSMSVNKILREGSSYRVFFNITEPNPDAILPQVITYKTLTLSIDKDKLGNSPYNFILNGFNSAKAN